MTSIATALGLVRCRSASAKAASCKCRSRAWSSAVLTTSLLITLVLVPTVYTLFEEGWKGLWKQGKAAEAPAH